MTLTTELIDAYLSQLTDRDIVSKDEWVNALLDIRNQHEQEQEIDEILRKANEQIEETEGDDK